MEQLLVPHQDGAAPGEAELPGGEVDNVEQVGDHPGDLPEGLVLHPRLTGLDEVQVILQKRGVQHRQQAVTMADGGGRLHVGVRDGLTADQVGAGLQTDEGDVLRGLPLDAGRQRVQINVALERQVTAALQALLLHQLLHAAAQTGDVSLGSGEVVVHDDAIAGLDKPGGQNVLAGPALMGGQAVLNAEQLLQFRLHLVKGLRPCVGVVRCQHGGLLPVGHGVHAGVRQHVQKDILIVQLEGVEPGLLHLLQPLLRGQQVQLLDDLHLVHLHGDGFVLVKCNGGHNALLLG